MANDDFTVGYKRPPKEHQFKKGMSGNPKGRPKGARSLPEEVRRALRRTIKINEDGRRREITVLAAALRRLVEQAVAKGELRAIQHILTLADTYGVEPTRAALPDEDRSLIASAIRRLEEREEEQ